MSIDLTGAIWRKSSYTQSNGACVEIAFQSNGACVEVALTPAVAGIRDSKQPDGGVVLASFPAWDAFRRAAKRAELDLR